MWCQGDFLHGRGSAHRTVWVEGDALDSGLDANAKRVGDRSFFPDGWHVFDRQVHGYHIVSTRPVVAIISITVCAVRAESVGPSHLPQVCPDKERSP
jgi:hypothetical protein